MGNVAHLILPDGLVALLTMTLDGEDVQIHYMPIADVVQPPRRQSAKALRMLADYLDNEAAEVEGSG